MKAPACLLAFAILTTVPACRHPSAVPPLISKNEPPQKTAAELLAEKNHAAVQRVVTEERAACRDFLVFKDRPIALGLATTYVGNDPNAYLVAVRKISLADCPGDFAEAFVLYRQAREKQYSGPSLSALMGGLSTAAATHGLSLLPMAGAEMSKGDAAKAARDKLEVASIRYGVEFPLVPMFPPRS